MTFTNSQLLLCRSLEIRIGYKTLLTQVNLSLEAGESIALTGVNGCGKTTLLRCLSGLSQPHAGEISHFESDLHSHRSAGTLASTANAINNNFCLYFASQPAYYRDLTVIQNVDFLCRAYGNKPSAARLAEAIGFVGLQHCTEQIAHTLSTGQKRRLTIAAALLLKPKLCIFDEPTNGLDAEGLELFFQFSNQLLALGGGIVTATHDQSLIAWSHRQQDVTAFVPKLGMMPRRPIADFS